MTGANTQIYQKGRDFVWTDASEGDFIEKLGTSGSVVAACRKTGCPRSTAYHHKAHDAGFAARWEAAIQVACARFEHAAIQRAVVGWEEPVFGPMGEGEPHGIIGYKRKYSDMLLARVLDAHHPDYKRTQDRGGSTVINIVNVLQDANDKARDQLLELTGGEPAAIETTGQD